MHEGEIASSLAWASRKDSFFATHMRLSAGLLLPQTHTKKRRRSRYPPLHLTLLRGSLFFSLGGFWVKRNFALATESLQISNGGSPPNEKRKERHQQTHTNTHIYPFRESRPSEGVSYACYIFFFFQQRLRIPIHTRKRRAIKMLPRRIGISPVFDI